MYNEILSIKNDNCLYRSKMKQLCNNIKADKKLCVDIKERNTLTKEERVFMDFISFIATKINFSTNKNPDKVWDNFLFKFQKELNKNYDFLYSL